VRAGPGVAEVLVIVAVGLAALARAGAGRAVIGVTGEP
jgi:hypothetical protein